MDIDRILRHDAKNVINSLQLNLEAFGMCESVQDRLECLDGIEQAAESGIEWVDQFERRHADVPAAAR